MGIISLGAKCACIDKGACTPKPPEPITPQDWMKCGCEALGKAAECFGETDAWIICAPDCETIKVAKKIRVGLGNTTAALDTSYSTEIIDCYRSFLVRPDEWRKHPELPECPKRGWYLYVECTKETIEIGPNARNGIPVYEATDGYVCFWRVNGSATKPCFNFTPPS